MEYRKWLGLVTSVVLVSACYGAMTAKAEYQRGQAYDNGPPHFKHSKYFKQAGPVPASVWVKAFDAFCASKAVVRKYQMAAYWYRKAADQGYPQAEFAMGAIYDNGPQGLPENAQKSFYWFHKAAENRRPWGKRSAQYPNEARRAMLYMFLAMDYMDGHGVPKDYVRAYKWFALSASQPGKHVASTVWMNAMAAKMTRSQVAQAQALAYAWAKAHAAKKGK